MQLPCLILQKSVLTYCYLAERLIQVANIFEIVLRCLQLKQCLPMTTDQESRREVLLAQMAQARFELQSAEAALQSADAARQSADAAVQSADAAVQSAKAHLKADQQRLAETRLLLTSATARPVGKQMAISSTLCMASLLLTRVFSKFRMH